MREDTKTVYRYSYIDITLSFLDISEQKETVLQDLPFRLREAAARGFFCITGGGSSRPLPRYPSSDP